MSKKSEAGRAVAGKTEVGAGEGGVDVRKLAAQRRIRAAKAFNEVKQELCRRFDDLTGGVAQRGIRAIMEWQRGHGLKADGKLGLETMRVAEGLAQRSATSDTSATSAGSRSVEHITFSDGEAESVTAEEAGAPDDEGGVENPSFDDQVLGGHAGLPQIREKGDALEKGGETVEQVSQLGELTGGGGLGEGIIKLAQAPAILDKLREGRYVEAFTDVAKGVGPKEAAEALAAVCEKLGLGRVSQVFETFASYGTEVNVLVGLVGWTWEGFKQIHEAHERGDAENRVDLYADAYAHAFLSGEQSGQAGLRAVTTEEHEAVERGRKDGTAAALATGPLATAVAKELLRRYRGADGAARHIKAYLLREAGLGGQAAARAGGA